MALRPNLGSGRSTGENDGSPESPSIIWRALNHLHGILLIIARFILEKKYGKHGQSMPPIDDRLLIESATSLAEKIRTKEVTSTRVMNAFIRRIKQINPLLNCVIDDRYKDALQEAAEVDELIASNKYTIDQLKESKPFLGVPMSVKDIIGVKGMVQSCGLWLRRRTRSSEDAVAVQLMRDAGAIPFVITNVPELCLWWESANKIYGRTRNPYDVNRTAGGSSGGEGSLLAAAGSPFGLGTDNGGSIRMPAFFNGIFGHKPSPLIVPNTGQWPEPTGIEDSNATVIGPMCRFACDLKPMLQVLTRDRATDLMLDEPINLSSLNYFYQENDGGALFVSQIDDDIRDGMENVIQYLQSDLCVRPQRVELTKLRDSMPIWMAIVMDEKADKIQSEFEDEHGRLNPYLELFKWIFRRSKHTFIAIVICMYARWCIKFDSPEYHSKLKERNDLRDEFIEMLGVDGVFIYPTHPTVAPYHNEPLVTPYESGYTAIFNVLGFPSTAVPLGLGPKEHVPIGIQVVANRNQDRLCLAVASELERAFGGWVAPNVIT